MTNFIPVFPLALVVFPDEQLNLHIFEPRYKQLITDCFTQKKPFGIPSVINDKLSERGTLMEITEITQVYEDGKMDIKTKGLRTFQILELIKSIPDKLYGGAIVSYPPNYANGKPTLMQQVLKGVRQLHENLGVTKQFAKSDDALQSFDVAHHMGLRLEEEFQLLEYEQELHRQEYLKRHLANVLPVMQEMSALQNKIKLNGHFKNLEGFNL
jgi:Lon protease-like protein